METLAEIKEKITPILKEYGVTHAEVFGSVAQGTAHEKSDVDLIVSLRKPIGLIKFFELNNKLEDVLGRNVGLATPSSLNKHLAERIAHDRISVYKG